MAELDWHFLKKIIFPSYTPINDQKCEKHKLLKFYFFILNSNAMVKLSPMENLDSLK